MTSKHPTVVFMGSPDFAVASLDALAASPRYRLALVVSQPDRPSGRGRRRVPTPVRARATELSLPTMEMSAENYDVVLGELRSLAAEVIVVVAFGIIVRRDILDLPPLGCINVHASLLPSHRGVSPIQAAILAGDTSTGCTTMRMDEGIDTGDLLLSESVAIAAGDTAGTLSERLSEVGARLLLRTLDGLVAATLEPAKQADSPTPYARKIRKKHGAVDWSLDAPSVTRRIRAMTPWPSAYTFLGGRRLIVLSAVAVDSVATASPGTVLTAAPLRVACGSGCVDVETVKPEGGRAMSAAAFVAGNPAICGAVLGDH